MPTEEVESPGKRMFHLVTGWIVVLGGSFLSYGVVTFLLTH